MILKLYFAHVAKSGGSTFALWIYLTLCPFLKKSFVQELHYPETQHFLKSNDIQSQCESRSNDTSLSDAGWSSVEFVSREWTGLSDPDAMYVTMIRNPIERIKSQYRHDYIHNPRRVNCTNSLEDLVMKCRTSPSFSCDNRAWTCSKYGNVYTSRFKPVEFFFVGITEYMSESQDRLREKLGFVTESAFDHKSVNTRRIDEKVHKRLFRGDETCGRECMESISSDIDLYHQYLTEFLDYDGWKDHRIVHLPHEVNAIEQTLRYRIEFLRHAHPDCRYYCISFGIEQTYAYYEEFLEHVDTLLRNGEFDRHVSYRWAYSTLKTLSNYDRNSAASYRAFVYMTMVELDRWGLSERKECVSSRHIDQSDVKGDYFTDFHSLNSRFHTKESDFSLGVVNRVGSKTLELYASTSDLSIFYLIDQDNHYYEWKTMLY